MKMLTTKEISEAWNISERKTGARKTVILKNYYFTASV